jgi:preprotein translocase subunit SecA
MQESQELLPLQPIWRVERILNYLLKLKAGGLAIVGTERHDSRRVDRQLRGRAGRQGDVEVHNSTFSEDNLMRLFGSERVAKVMDRMGLEEGEVIQHSMMTNLLTRTEKSRRKQLWCS